jgi:hypothetical protein
MSLDKINKIASKEVSTWRTEAIERKKNIDSIRTEFNTTMRELRKKKTNKNKLWMKKQ